MAPFGEAPLMCTVQVAYKKVAGAVPRGSKNDQATVRSKSRVFIVALILRDS